MWDVEELTFLITPWYLNRKSKIDFTLQFLIKNLNIWFERIGQIWLISWSHCIFINVRETIPFIKALFYYTLIFSSIGNWSRTIILEKGLRNGLRKRGGGSSSIIPHLHTRHFIHSLFLFSITSILHIIFIWFYTHIISFLLILED